MLANMSLDICICCVHSYSFSIHKISGEMALQKIKLVINIELKDQFSVKLHLKKVESYNCHLVFIL